MIIKGRSLSDYNGEGIAIKTSVPISFLGDIDPKTGIVEKKESEIYGQSIKGKVLVFPSSTGSTVGSYVIYALKEYSNSPAGFVAGKGEPIVTAGANMANIPFVDKIDISLIENGDKISVNGKEGTIEIHNVKNVKVSTSILMNRGHKILLVKRSKIVSSYQEMWAAISGSIEKDETPEQCAMREIWEETGIRNVKLVKKNEEIYVRNKNIIYTVYTLLFNIETEKVQLNWENTEYRWVDIKELDNYNTVPKLKEEIHKLLSGSGEGSKPHSV